MSLFFFSLLLVLSLEIRIDAAHQPKQLEFEVIKDRFVSLKINITKLFPRYDDHQKAENKTISYEYMLMQIEEPDLPKNWKYMILGDARLLIIYGLPKSGDEQLVFEFLQLDTSHWIESRALIKLSLQHDNQDNTYTVHEKASETEVAFEFHNTSLSKFLLNNQADLVDRTFSSRIWPGSKLTSVEEKGTDNVLIRLRNNAGNNSAIERIKAEVDRATRGQMQSLCQFKKSKAISIEHLFTSANLYPNWCTFNISKVINAS